jgi:hypothetical protein
VSWSVSRVTASDLSAIATLLRACVGGLGLREPVQHCPDASDLDERLRGLHLELVVTVVHGSGAA